MTHPTIQQYLLAYLPYIVIIIGVIVLNGLMLSIPYQIGKSLQREHFTNTTDESLSSSTSNGLKMNVVTLSTPEEIYDRFYSQIYEKIIGDYTDYRVEFECKDLYQQTNLQKYSSANAKILDLGCGIGSHLATLASKHKQFVYYGVDSSESMLDVARRKTKSFSNVRLIQGEMQDSTLFGKNEFSHVVMYYFSIYYTTDMSRLLSNLHQWIKPAGYLVVHLVDKYKFDPVLDASNPFPAFSFQKYSEKRRNKSVIHFERFVYESEFKVGADNQATFSETFKYPERNYIRKQHHQMHMPNVNDMVKTIKSHGFTLRHTTNMVDVGYEYQYLCYFTKN